MSVRLATTLAAALLAAGATWLHNRTRLPPAAPPADPAQAAAPSGRPDQPDPSAPTAAAPSATTAPVADDVPGVRRRSDGTLDWPRPRNTERQAERERMVRTQIAASGFLRDGITDERVLAAMRAVPRHAFVPPNYQSAAYDDTPLPIGHGQTISQPYIVALMTELLELHPGDRVLEIGTGSGYQAAVLAELTPYVYTIEIIEPLQRQAAERLQRLGYATVRCRLGDGYDGWPEYAPFDAIIVTCAAGHVPAPLWDQLKPGGRMVIPIGGTYDTQRLVVLTKQADGSRKSRSVLPVRFVPMTGRIQQP
jgi:protein-L-isoaspartate(D-aspartate) O-methyltransferase